VTDSRNATHKPKVELRYQLVHDSQQKHNQKREKGKFFSRGKKPIDMDEKTGNSRPV